MPSHGKCCFPGESAWFWKCIQKNPRFQCFLRCTRWPVMSGWWMMLYAYTWKMLSSWEKTHGFENAFKTTHVFQCFLRRTRWPVMSGWWMMLYVYTWKMLFSWGKTHGFENAFKKPPRFPVFLRCSRLQFFSKGGDTTWHTAEICTKELPYVPPIE